MNAVAPVTLPVSPSVYAAAPAYGYWFSQGVAVAGD